MTAAAAKSSDRIGGTETVVDFASFTQTLCHLCPAPKPLILLACQSADRTNAAPQQPKSTKKRQRANPGAASPWLSRVKDHSGLRT
jgi:hypothetical protein